MSGWWIPIAAPIATLLMSVLVIQLHEQQEKQQLMALFSMHVSPGTAELIWRHKGTVLQPGRTRCPKAYSHCLVYGYSRLCQHCRNTPLSPAATLAQSIF